MESYSLGEVSGFLFRTVESELSGPELSRTSFMEMPREAVLYI